MSTPSAHHNTPPSAQGPGYPGPGTSQQPEAGTKKPETLQQVIQLWSVMVILELIHQILNVIMSLTDPSAMRAAVRQQDAAEGLSDSVINSTVTAATLVTGLFNVIIVGVLAWMILIVNRRGKRMATAFMLLIVFTFFFVFRALLVFLASPSNDIPVALYAIDGSIQILLAVAGVIAYMLSRKPEVIDWIGPRISARDANDSRDTKDNKDTR